MTAAPRMRWGVLGTARIARTIIAAIRSGGAGEVVAVASRDPARAQAFAQELAIPRVLPDYRTLVADPGIDVLYCPLPVAQHAPWALAAIDAGKHVLVEKPFAMSAAEAERVFAAAAARGVTVGEAFMCRFHPLTERARAVVAEGTVGTPRLVRSTFAVAIADTHDGALDIRWQAEQGGGAMRDLGVYCVGISRLLLGEDPIEAQATATLRHGVDASIAGALRFPSGALATFACSMEATFDCSYEIIGSAGRVRVDRGGMVAWPGSAFPLTCWFGDQVRHEEIPPANHYERMIQSFARSLQGEDAFGVAPADTLAMARAVDAVLAAAPLRAAAG